VVSFHFRSPLKEVSMKPHSGFPSPKRWFFLVLAGSLLLAGRGQAVPPNGPKPPKNPVSLEVVGTKNDIVATQVNGGWPLTILCAGNNELGLGISTSIFPQDFPDADGDAVRRTGYLVFEDPDGCVSFVSPPDPLPCTVVDETMLKFTVGVVQAGVPVDGGTALGGEPQLPSFDDDLAGYAPVAIGPFTGGTVPDNFGFGVKPDFPNLVILANSGVGLGFDPNVESDQTLHPDGTQRNLAGFVQSVSYVLNDAIPTAIQPGRTVIHAHMNVSADLIKPVVAIDNCIGPGTDAECSEGPRIYSIDGEAPLTNLTEVQFRPILNSRVITLRIFVVNGNAPETLSDVNGDGIVSSADAQALGYELLSDEEIVRVKVLNQELHPYDLLADFDGNGRAEGIVVAPAGPGGITPVPR
jgi:hypothetical protein